MHRRVQQHFFLLATILNAFILTLQASAAVVNISRDKNATMSATYTNTSASNANDGNYANSNLDLCATVTPAASSSASWWTVDLGNLYIIVSVTIYSSAVLPDSTFARDLTVYMCITSPNAPTSGTGITVPPGGNATVTFSGALRLARYVKIQRSSYDMTLCEVDVIGSLFLNGTDSKISSGKPANQSGTYNNRNAGNAVDDTFDPSSLDTCATAYSYSTTNPNAWWQLDLTDQYLVTSVTIYFPAAAVGRDAKYMTSFYVYVGVDPLQNYYGNCDGYSSLFSYQGQVNGSLTVNCSRSTQLYIFGRYIRIEQYWSQQYSSVMTICQVVVRGVKQIDGNDPTLNIFTPSPTSVDQASVIDGISRALAIAAIVIASVSALFSIIMLAVCIKLIQVHKKIEKEGAKSDAKPSKPNNYQMTEPAEPAESASPTQRPLPSPPAADADDLDYVNVNDTYDDVAPTGQTRPYHDQKPRR
jgi:hypothetical protein